MLRNAFSGAHPASPFFTAKKLFSVFEIRGRKGILAISPHPSSPPRADPPAPRHCSKWSKKITNVHCVPAVCARFVLAGIMYCSLCKTINSHTAYRRSRVPYKNSREREREREKRMCNYLKQTNKNAIIRFTPFNAINERAWCLFEASHTPSPSPSQMW